MIRELSTLENTGDTTFADTDYAANAAESVSSRFAELPAAEAPEVVETPETKPSPNRTLPLSATQKALLDSIADVESNGKWNIIVGGKTFNSYDDHPRVVGVRTEHGPSTAAGRYQIVASTYDDYAKRLGVKGFSPDVQDVIALSLAENAYKEATGRDIYKDLEGGRADDVRRVLAGKGAATVWQGLQKDNNFSERFNNYRKKYSSGEEAWYPPMAKKPESAAPVDPPSSNVEQPPNTAATKPVPSSVTTGVDKKDTEIEKVDAKLDDGLSGIDPATLPADLRKKYDEIKTKRAVLTERFSELQQRASTRIDELQPTFEETQEYKDAFANYEKSVNDLATEVLTGVVEKTNGYNSLKLRLEHQVRNNIISLEYANKQLSDYVNKSLGSQPEYIDAKKKLDTDFNTGYKGLIETYITNDPVYQGINQEITDLQKKADEEGAVFSKEWDDIAESYNKAAKALTCGPDIPEEECQSDTPYYSKTVPNSYDIEQETNRLLKQQERLFAKDTTGKYRTEKKWDSTIREYVTVPRAATIDDLPPEVKEAQQQKKQAALRREFEELSPIAMGTQYIVEADKKRREYGSSDLGNYEVENQALSIYLDKLNEARTYTDAGLRNKYGARYESLIKEMNAVSRLRDADKDYLNKAKEVNSKYADILQDKDFQFVFKQVPQYQNRALESSEKIIDKYKQNDRVKDQKEAQDFANKNPTIGAIKAFVLKVAGAGLAIPSSVLETLGSAKPVGFVERYVAGQFKELGEDIRVQAMDLSRTPLAEKMQGQMFEKRTKTKDNYTVVWDGDTNNVAYIRNPDGSFFKGNEEQRNNIVNEVKGKAKETGINLYGGVGQAVESFSYMAAIIGATGVAMLTRGQSLAGAASFLAGFGQIQASAYEEALKEAGMKVDDGLLVSAAIGLASSTIERFNPIETAIFSKSLSGSFTRDMATRYAAGRATFNNVLWEASKNFAKSGLKEFAIEELPQHLSETMIKKYANSNLGANYKNLDLNAEQLYDLAAISIGIGGVIPGVGTLRGGRSGLGKTALQSIVANPNVYREYMDALEQTNPDLAASYRGAIEPILRELNSVPDLAPNKRLKAADILYDIRSVNKEIDAATTTTIKNRKIAERTKLEDKLNKLLERPGVDINSDRNRRNAIEALDNELQQVQQTTDNDVQNVERSSMQAAGQQVADRLDFLEARMDSADYIDQSEIDESVNDLYDLWDRVDTMEDLTPDQKEATKAAIEDKINKLEQYEFSTTTQAGQTTKTTAVKGVRVIGRTAKETPSKFQVTPERIAGQGDTTVTRADGTTANGTFVLNDDGTIDVRITDGRTVDPRTGTVGVANIPVDANFIEFVETQKDANGTVTGATIYDAKNNVSYTITDPDLALDMAIKAKTAALGPIEQAEFEKIIEEVERTTPAKTTLADGTEVSLSELNRRANEVANRIRQIENRLGGTISKSEKTKLKKELAKLKKERDAIQKQKTGKEVVRNRPEARRKVGKQVQAESKEPTGAGTAEQTEDGTQEEGGVIDTKQTLMTDPMLSDAPIVRSDGKGVTSFGPDPGAVKRIMDKSGITAKIKAMLDSKLISPVEATFLESYIAEKIQNLLDRAGRTAFSTDRLGSETKMFFYSNENDFYDSINSFGVNEDGTFKYGYPGARYGANPKAVDGLYSFDQLSGIGRIDINLSSLMDAYLNKLDDLQTSENPDGIPFLDFSSSINNLDNFVDKVVGHEAAHAVLFKLFGDSPKLFEELRNKIAALVKDSVLTGKLKGFLPDGEVTTIEKYLENFSKKYNKVDSYEEWLVELAALMKMAGGLPPNAIKPTFKGKLLDILDTVISTLTGGKLRLKDYVRQDRVIEFFTSLVSSLDQYNAEEIFLLRSSADAIARDAKGLLSSPQSLHFRGSLKEGQLSSTGRKASVPSKASIKTVTPKIVDKTMLIGKTYSATMSDHTKVDCYFNKRTGVKVCGMMGGTMFPYIEEMEKLGYVWASKDVGKARALVKNASGVDYTLVYRMNRSTGSLGNLDTAEAALAELDYVYNKLDAAGKENFVKLLNDRLASMDSGRILFSDERINKKVIKYQKTDKKGNPAVGSKGNPLFAFKVPEGGGFSSYDEFKTAIKNKNLPFQTRAIWEDIFLKDDIISPKNAWHQLLKDNGGANLKELVDNLAEDATDQAVDGDIVSVLKIAEPEYDKKGNIIVYTPFEELVNEKKGVYFAQGAPKHRTYPYFVKGKPVGLLNEFNSVYEYFPYIKEVVESGRLKHPYKAIETMMKELLATFKVITGLTFSNRKPNIKEVVEIHQKLSKSPNNKELKNQAAVVTFDHTGYVSTDFWVNNLKDKTKYLDDVLKNILTARAELMAGDVSAKKVARAYLITVASQGSAGGTYSDWSDKREKKVGDIFVETSKDNKNKDIKWVRPEGAAAAYLSTFEGEELVDALIAQTATEEQVRRLYDYVGFGYMASKTENTMKTMADDGINKMTQLFLSNRGTDFQQLYKGAIKNFFGVGVGKTGFFNQYFGVSSQGVVDARQMNAWIAGSMKLTEEQKEQKKKIAGSNALQKELLDRIYKVGIALGYAPDVAGYLAHHAIWDGIKNSMTTHAGEYAVVSNGFMPGSMMTRPFSDKWELSMSEAEVEEASGDTYIESQEIESPNSKFTRAKKRYMDDLYGMWGKWFSSKFPNLKDMPILDIGSGMGQAHSKFAPRKKPNISTAEPMYDPASFKEESGVSSPTYTRNDGSDIPSEAFDIVLNSGSISEYPADTREAVLRTAARATKPGGVSVINAMTREYVDFLKKGIEKNPKQGKILSDSEVLINDGGKMTYIKGFSQSELEAYVSDVLGRNYNVIKAPEGVMSMATVVVEKSLAPSRLVSKASLSSPDQVGVELAKAANITAEQAGSLSKVIRTVKNNIAKRMGIPLNDYLRRSAIRVVPNVRDFITDIPNSIYSLRGLSSDIIKDFSNSVRETSVAFQGAFGTVNDKYIKNNGLTSSDYVLSAVLDIDNAGGFKFLGFTEKLSSYRKDRILDILNERLSDLKDRAQNSSEFYIQSFSKKWLEDGQKRSTTEMEKDNFQLMLDGNQDVIKAQIEHVQSQQRANLMASLNYLVPSNDYTPEFKFLMTALTLRGASSSPSYKRDADGNIVDTIPGKDLKRTKETVGNHEELSSLVLPNVFRDFNSGISTHPMELIEKYTDKSVINRDETWELVKDRVFKEADGGYWIKFDRSSEDSDIQALTLVSKKVSKVMKPEDNPWCTGGGMATTYLPKGDFYLFLDAELEPQITVRYEDDTIAELRGTDKGQALSESQSEIADKILDDIPNGKDYKSQVKASKVYHRLKNDIPPTTKQDIQDFFDVYHIDLITYSEDKEFEFRDLKDSSTQAYIQANNEIKVYDEIVLGSDVKKITVTKEYAEKYPDSPLLKRKVLVIGDVSISYNFNDTVFPDGLEVIGILEYSSRVLKSDFKLPNNLKVNGILKITNTIIEQGFILPEGLQVSDTLTFLGTTIPQGFTLPEGLKVGGTLNFSGIALPQGFTLPEGLKIDGTLNFTRTILPQGFTLPEGLEVGEVLNFTNATIPQGFTLPERLKVGWTLNFSGTTLPQGFTLPEGVKVGRDLDFSGTTLPQGFTLPEGFEVSRDITFAGATLPQDFTLPERLKVGEDLIFSRTILPQSFILPEGLKVDGILNFSRATIPQGFTLPEGLKVGGTLNYEAVKYENGESAESLFKEWENKRSVVNQDSRGAILETPTSVLTLLDKDNADVTTPIHEVAHEYEKVLTADERKVMEDWSGAKFGTTKFREAFAKGAERYLYEGASFNGKVDAIFAKFKEWFKGVIRDAAAYFGDINQFTPTVREVYAKMLADGDIEIQQPPIVQKRDINLKSKYEVKRNNKGIVSKASVSTSVEPRPDQLNVIENAGREYTDNMVDDGNGNYIFYHVAPTDLSNDVIDPKFFGRNLRTGRDERPGVNIAMYYTEPGKVDVSGDFTHIVRIPKNMVYPFNKDPLNFYDEAKKRFLEKYPGQAFDANKQVGFISQIAAENGYPLVVAKWGGVSPLRAQTAIAIKPELLKDRNQVYLPEVETLKKGENPIKSKESRADVTTVNKASFESNVQPEVDRIKALPVPNVDGATFNLDGSKYINGGLIVPVGSKNVAQSRLSARAIYDFMMSNKDNISSPIFKIGLFKFEDQPTVSIDLNIVIPREYRDIGLTFGRLAGQKSLWDMDANEEVNTGATGDNPITYSSEQYKEIAKELAQGRVPDFVYTAAGETPPGKTKTATSRLKSKMSAAGERGIQKFHNAVGESVSIRFLDAAKNMENRFGIKPEDWLRTLPDNSAIKRMLSKIKILTGYERGADGNWRYEVSDRDAKIIGESKLRKDLRNEQEGVKLSEIMEHDELFKFYPELKDLPVIMFNGYDFEFDASYQRETNNMYVSSDLSGDILKTTMLHEIQHYIQVREGFDIVGAREMNKLQNNVLWSLGLDLDGYDSFKEAYDSTVESVKELILEGKSVLDIYDGGYTKFFFGNNPKQLMRYMMTEKTAEVLSRLPANKQQSFFNDSILPNMEDLQSMIADSVNEVYWNNISEIEARNIEKRMDMTKEDLKKSLMSDTEGIERSEQIASGGYIRQLYDFLVAQEDRTYTRSTEAASVPTRASVKEQISKKPEEYLKTLLAGAVNKGVKTISTTRRGNLTVSDFNTLINGLVNYIKVQIGNVAAGGVPYRISNFIDDIKNVSSLNVDMATAASLFDEAGVTGTAIDPKIEEDVMRQSLIDAGFPPQMAAMLAKGDTLYDYANSNKITKKSC